MVSIENVLLTDTDDWWFKELSLQQKATQNPPQETTEQGFTLFILLFLFEKKIMFLNKKINNESRRTNFKRYWREK